MAFAMVYGMEVCNKGSRRYYVQSARALPTHEKTLQDSSPPTSPSKFAFMRSR